VVGHSLALRLSAALLGVKVSVVCPGYVQSGINKAVEMVTLLTISKDEAVMRSVPFRPMDTRRAARIILPGVAHNRALIVFPAHARLLWWLSRLSYSLLEPAEKRQAQRFHQVQAPRS
jgi:short-subunit dehydrogenase